jgi:hypothetical protein
MLSAGLKTLREISNQFYSNPAVRGLGDAQKFAELSTVGTAVAAGNFSFVIKTHKGTEVVEVRDVPPQAFLGTGKGIQETLHTAMTDHPAISERNKDTFQGVTRNINSEASVIGRGEIFSGKTCQQGVAQYYTLARKDAPKDEYFDLLLTAERLNEHERKHQVMTYRNKDVEFLSHSGDQFYQGTSRQLVHCISRGQPKREQGPITIFLLGVCGYNTTPIFKFAGQKPLVFIVDADGVLRTLVIDATQATYGDATLVYVLASLEIGTQTVYYALKNPTLAEKTNTGELTAGHFAASRSAFDEAVDAFLKCGALVRDRYGVYALGKAPSAETVLLRGSSGSAVVYPPSQPPSRRPKGVPRFFHIAQSTVNHYDLLRYQGDAVRAQFGNRLTYKRAFSAEKEPNAVFPLGNLSALASVDSIHALFGTTVVQTGARDCTEFAGQAEAYVLEVSGQPGSMADRFIGTTQMLNNGIIIVHSNQTKSAAEAMDTLDLTAVTAHRGPCALVVMHHRGEYYVVYQPVPYGALVPNVNNRMVCVTRELRDNMPAFLSAKGVHSLPFSLFVERGNAQVVHDGNLIHANEAVTALTELSAAEMVKATAVFKSVLAQFSVIYPWNELVVVRDRILAAIAKAEAAPKVNKVSSAAVMAAFKAGKPLPRHIPRNKDLSELAAMVLNTRSATATTTMAIETARDEKAAKNVGAQHAARQSSARVSRQTIQSASAEQRADLLEKYASAILTLNVSTNALKAALCTAAQAATPAEGQRVLLSPAAHSALQRHETSYVHYISAVAAAAVGENWALSPSTEGATVILCAPNASDGIDVGIPISVLSWATTNLLSIAELAADARNRTNFDILANELAKSRTAKGQPGSTGTACLIVELALEALRRVMAVGDGERDVNFDPTPADEADMAAALNGTMTPEIWTRLRARSDFFSDACSVVRGLYMFVLTASAMVEKPFPIVPLGMRVGRFTEVDTYTLTTAETLVNAAHFTGCDASGVIDRARVLVLDTIYDVVAKAAVTAMQKGTSVAANTVRKAMDAAADKRLVVLQEVLTNAVKYPDMNQSERMDHAQLSLAKIISLGKVPRKRQSSFEELVAYLEQAMLSGEFRPTARLFQAVLNMYVRWGRVDVKSDAGLAKFRKATDLGIDNVFKGTGFKFVGVQKLGGDHSTTGIYVVGRDFKYSTPWLLGTISKGDQVAAAAAATTKAATATTTTTATVAEYNPVSNDPFESLGPAADEARHILRCLATGNIPWNSAVDYSTLVRLIELLDCKDTATELIAEFVRYALLNYKTRDPAITYGHSLFHQAERGPERLPSTKPPVYTPYEDNLFADEYSSEEDEPVAETCAKADCGTTRGSHNGVRFVRCPTCGTKFPGI